MSGTLKEHLIETVIPAMRMHEAYAAELVADVDEDAMDQVPGAGHENTPRFTLGHLCYASSLSVWVLENPNKDYPADPHIDPVFVRLFARTGPSDRRMPEPDSSAPTRERLLREFAHQHDEVERVLREVSEETLLVRRPWRLAKFLPRMADIVVFQGTIHEAMHLGQIASWRRAMNLPAALARMPAT